MRNKPWKIISVSAGVPDLVSLLFVCFLAGLQLSGMEILPDPYNKL